jgi:ACDE family multidrug resistance protein
MTVALAAVAVLLPRSPRPDHHTSLLAPLRGIAPPSAPSPLHLGLGSGLFSCGVVLAVASVFVAPWLQRRFGVVRTLYMVLALFALDLASMGLFTDSRLALILAVVVAGAFLGVNNTLVNPAEPERVAVR